MDNSNINPELLKMARSRVNFKAHFIIFILGNVMLWLLWIMLYYIFNVGFPWALFPTLGWGIALLFHYFKVFKWNEKWVEQEYSKLIEEGNSRNTSVPPKMNS
jgi:hypothetical protein